MAKDNLAGTEELVLTGEMAPEEIVPRKTGMVVDEKESKALRKKALALKQSINRASIELAEVLHEIYHAELWRGYGFNSFAQYTESELEVGYRSAMYSVRIIEAVLRYNISMTQARELGWGRLRAILPHITDLNVNTLVEMASKKSVRDIQKELSEHGEIVGGQEYHRITLLCSDSESSVIYDALDEAKKRINTESSGSAVSFIAQEWLMTNEGDVSQVSLEQIIEFAYRNYGVTLSVDAEEGQQDVEGLVKGD